MARKPHTKYCKKCYNEGESTGNMSKHVRALHRSLMEDQNGKISKPKVSDSRAEMRRVLRISQSISNEYEKNVQNFRTALLAAEGFLPLNIVEAESWGPFTKRRDQLQAPIRSKAAFVKMLKTYSAMLDQTLCLNLKDTQFVNVQLNIRTARSGESYMGLMVSFAPNVWNTKTLDEVEDHNILMNDEGAAKNVHQLDYVCLGGKPPKPVNVLTVLLQLLRKYELTEKVATITMDTASLNASLYQSLVLSLSDDKNCVASRLVGKARYVRSASHVLDAQVDAIVLELSKYSDFANALHSIKMIAKITRRSTRIRLSMKKDKVPFLPLETSTRGMYIWRQVNAFLKASTKYTIWFLKHEENGDKDIVSMLREYIHFDQEILKLLQYFVHSLQPLYDLSSKVQNDAYNHLSNGVPLYYLAEEFYFFCQRASEGSRIPRAAKGPDFSCLNGAPELTRAHKLFVLNSILKTRASYDKHMVSIRQDPLSYVAVILDPGARTEALDKMMPREEAEERVGEAYDFLKSYLQRMDEPVASNPSKSCQPHGFGNNEDFIFDQAIISKFSYAPTSDEDATSIQESRAELMQELGSYLEEKKLEERTKETAIAWWYKNRKKYKRLFPLAVSLFYTKLSSCEVEKTYPLASRFTKRGRGWLSSGTFRLLLLLRDRFDKFGFYKLGAMPLRNFFDGDEPVNGTDGASDSNELYPASDDALYESDSDLDDTEYDYPSEDDDKVDYELDRELYGVYYEES
ncbi:putative transposase of the Rover4 hAT-like family [Lachancea sp. 'fantastica']|nr:putative transposase of the Rover4 hAT-like family [Lachancea sp. 'fantastica']